MEENKFELPKRWCIKGDYNKIVQNFFLTYKDNPISDFVSSDSYTEWYFTSETVGGYYAISRIPKNYKEITFPQFEKYVLKNKKEMTNEELLEEAKRRFGNLPVGTEIRGSRWEGSIKDSNYEFEARTGCVWIMSEYITNNMSIDLYQDGKWAEIVSKPKEEEPNKKRAVYVETDEQWKFVISKDPNKKSWSGANLGSRNNCINIETKSSWFQSDRKYYEKGGYEIVSFDDWTMEKGYRSEWLRSKEEPMSVTENQIYDKLKEELARLESKTVEDFYNCKIWLGEETSTALKEKVCDKLLNLGVTGTIQIDNKRGLALFIDSRGRVGYSHSYDNYMICKSKAITLEDLGMEPEKRMIDFDGRKVSIPWAYTTIQGGIDYGSIRGHHPESIVVDDLGQSASDAHIESMRKYMEEVMVHSMRMPESLQGAATALGYMITKKISLDKDGILSAPISKKKKRKVRTEIFAKPEIVELNIKKRRK